MTAVENTWIHGRQKRREQKRQLRELPRAPHCAKTSSETAVASAAPATTSASTQTSNSSEDSSENKAASAPELAGQQQTDSGASSSEKSKHNILGEQKEVVEHVPDEDVDMDSGSVEHFLFKCLLNVMPEESDVVIEMHWVEGHNKDLMNQLCTYLKNTLLKSVTKS